MKTKSIGALLIAGLVVLSAMAGIASAQDDPIDPTLWLYIEGSTYNPSTLGDDWIAESWINPVAFTYDTTYTDYVDVIVKQTSPEDLYAENPYFFVWVKDDTLISSITVGQAHLFLGGTDQGVNDGATVNSTFVDSSTQSGDTNDPDPNKHQGQEGYWVRVRIGDVPRSPDHSYGDPTEGTFNPDNLKDYVRVPVTYTLTDDTSKDLTGLIIHHDAHNTEGVGTDKKYDSNTPNSHDSSSYYIPEFSTLAIPMIIAILTGLFFLSYRKRREE